MREHPPVPGENHLREEIRNSQRGVTERDFHGRLAEYLRQGKLRAVNPYNRAPYDPALSHLDPADPMWALDAAERERALELLGQLVRTDDAGFTSVVCQSSTANAADAMEKQERQGMGLFTLPEAAQFVGDSIGISTRQLLSDLRAAVRNGGLRLRKSGTLVQADRSKGESGNLVTPADLDALFAAWGVPYRFPKAEHTAGDSIPHTAEELTFAPSVVHKLQTRRDVLDPIIDIILNSAGSNPDRVALWSELVRLASSDNPPAPLLEFVEGDIKYQGTTGTEFLNREAFGKRLKRRFSKGA